MNMLAEKLATISTNAWVLADGTNGNQFERREVSLSYDPQTEVVIKPIYASWEANTSHAIESKPINILRARKEKIMTLGNSAVCRVVSNETGFGPMEGQICVVYGASSVDDKGYMLKATGYDGVRSRGVLSMLTAFPAKYCVPINPENLPLQSWASFGVKFGTGWSCFNLAKRVHEAVNQEIKQLNVFGWGGGTTLAALSLAVKQGHKAFMVCGSDNKASEASELGIEVIDRREFPYLDHGLLNGSKEEVRSHMRSEAKFLKEVRNRTEGNGADLFIDFVGEPLINATERAMARGGVIATSGWKTGVNVEINRARSSIGRISHIHSHYCSLPEFIKAVAFSETESWLPKNWVEGSFENVSQFHDTYAKGGIDSYFPIVKIGE